MMKKLFFILFTIGTVLAFTACGSDDPEDYTLYDNTPLVGNYKGNCKIETTDIVRPAKEFPNSDVKLDKTNDANVLLLTTTQYGTIIDSRLNQFKNTPAKDAYTFNMSGFSLKNFTETNIPSYIKDWFSNDYTKINSVNITLNGTSAKYIIASKTLTFTYSGKLEIQGKVNDQNRNDTYQIKYTYSVVKQ